MQVLKWSMQVAKSLVYLHVNWVKKLDPISNQFKQSKSN